ncbi:MAG: hypothetical protein GY866_19930 [Proteobacteria bacterium]|nr:hypothetical protein [Pseudomonadota bacterium]
MTPEEIRKQVAKYYTSIRNLDADAWAAGFAEAGTLEDPVGTPVIGGGRDKLKRFFSNAVQSVFASFEMNEESVFAVPDGAAVKWSCQAATHNGDALSFQGISVFEFDDSGLIGSMKAYWDPTKLFESASASSKD